MYRSGESLEIILDSPSLYPEEERKSREERRKDLEAWAEKYQENCEWYNLYGMDLKSAAPCDDWLDYGVFRKIRHDINARYYPKGSAFPYDYTLFMRDKFSFEMFMQMVCGKNSGKYIPSVGCMIGKTVYKKNAFGGLAETPSLLDIFREYDGKKLVMKDSFGESGTSVWILTIRGESVIYYTKEQNSEGKTVLAEHVSSPDEFASKIAHPKKTWLIQEYIQQDPVLNTLCSTSVNTMRIVSFHTGERVVVPERSIIRFGKEGALLDNADSGGRSSAVDADGRVRSQAFDFINTAIEENPHAGLLIPGYRDAVELVKTLHSFIPQLFTVGWDVAFTVNGPAVVEGNDGWDVTLNQPPRGNAMRKIWDELVKEREAFGAKQ